MTDYFMASFEDGGLVLEPHCSCGEALDEDYFCPSCQRQCTCLEVRCRDSEALSLMKALIRENPSFHNFKAVLVLDSED